ncbi:MAG TPA: hypothetical protein EYM37_13505 [Methylophaga aminisulfidivorans]|uniref:hypothetical protein n=1 Tax=Methylophaga TaxID=40222 RepID=UPI0017726288|nr:MULTISPECIES: hypothetical protein [Methylophaga]HIC46221.1 hypothetical protein [Methylophaga sp.]HIM40930.1 hypothetical protein [Methylophaga aminisulfidivorans]
MKTRIRFILYLLFISLLSACGDNEEEYDLTASDSTVPSPIEKDDIPQWLEPYDSLAPEDWLILRSAAALRGEVTDREHRLEILQHASHHFRESPRMIANRAVQLEDMLLEIGIEESAVSLIDMFTHLPTEGTPHNFSAYCQYYFNIRAKGYHQGYALTQLSKLK